MHHSAANTHTYVNSWALFHQTASPMRESALLEQHTYTTFRTLLKIAEHCYVEHQGQGLPHCSQQRLDKELAKEIPEAKWEIQNINNNPYHVALGPGQHSGLNKNNKLPNDHPQAPEGPDKTSALISTDQPHNCDINKAPQNSSSQNLTRKVND